MQHADIFAKPSKKATFDELKELMGMRRLTNTNYEECFDLIKSIIHNC